MKKLCRALSDSEAIGDNDIIAFERLLANKFPSFLIVSEDDDDDAGGQANTQQLMMDGDMGDDDDDSDGPVIVGVEEFQASMARTSEQIASLPRLSDDVRRNYPLLVAAIQPHEDILMTCARALDAKVDVSLVREAAAYLEDIEQMT